MNSLPGKSVRMLDNRVINYPRKNLDRIRSLQTQVRDQKANMEEAKRK